jgi:signal transduction histidine kinase
VHVIFEKFRQGGNTMTDKPRERVLGLPISRQIVEYFGGNLWVRKPAR